LFEKINDKKIKFDDKKKKTMTDVLEVFYNYEKDYELSYEVF